MFKLSRENEVFFAHKSNGFAAFIMIIWSLSLVSLFPTGFSGFILLSALNTSLQEKGLDAFSQVGKVEAFKKKNSLLSK